MTGAADFMCPRCTSRYKLVRVRADPKLPSRLIHCRVCKEPFTPTDGEYVLKYFLVDKTTTPRKTSVEAAVSAEQPRGLSATAGPVPSRSCRKRGDERLRRMPPSAHSPEMVPGAVGHNDPDDHAAFLRGSHQRPPPTSPASRGGGRSISTLVRAQSPIIRQLVPG